MSWVQLVALHKQGVIPELGQWRQEDQKYKVALSNRVQFKANLGHKKPLTQQKLLELHTLKIRLSKYKEAFLSQMLGTALDELGNELKHYTKN